MDLDITGLSYAILERDGPQQWPYPEGASSGKVRLYEDGIFPTPTGKARFFTGAYRPVAERVDARFPLQLNTGRLRDQWHGMSRTGNVAQLFGHAPEPRLGMSPTDLTRRGLADGELVRVESRRGAIHVIASADPGLRSGQAWLPMHWGKRFLGGRGSAGTNTLTNAAFDPHSRQPELKHAAVKVTAVALAWRLVAFGTVAPEELVATLERLRELQDEVAFQSVTPIGRERPGVLVRCAHGAAPPEGWLERLDAILGLDAPDALRYDDPRRGAARRILIAADRIAAARLSGGAVELASGEWLKDWLASGNPVAEIRRLLLMPSVKPPAGFIAPGRTVCNCFGVTEDAIEATLAQATGTAAERVAMLQARTQCGTRCGSCVPELKARAAQAAQAAQAA